MNVIYPGTRKLLVAYVTNNDGDQVTPDGGMFAIKRQGSEEAPTYLIGTISPGKVEAYWAVPDDATAGVYDWVCDCDGVIVDEKIFGTLIVTEQPFSYTEQPHRVYYGVGAAGIVTPSTIMAMSHKDLISTRDWTCSVSPDDQKIYLAAPWEVIAAYLGFGVDLAAATTVTLNDYGGNAATYYLYESTNLLTGASMALVVSEDT